MKNKVFEGIATALVTPFSDGVTDYAALERIIERQIALKVSALVVAGTTGEAPTLTQGEWESLIEYSVAVVRGRVPVIAGAGSNSTDAACARAKRAEALGADAVLVVTPYYNKASREGLYMHYERVCGATSLPVVAYNVPSRTGVDLGVDTLERLSGIPNFAGIKEASGSVSRSAHIISRFGKELPVYSGCDEINLPIFSIGGAGAVSVVSNVFPKECAALWECASRGDVPRAAAISDALFPFVRALFSEVNPIPVKTVMAHLGQIKEEFRLPLCETDERKRAALVAEYERTVGRLSKI